MNYINSDWVYDLESYPNIFTFCIVHSSGKHMRVFEVSDRKDDSDSIYECLRYLVRNKCRMVGFNNVGFDYNLIHHIIEVGQDAKKKGKTPKVDYRSMYSITVEIIESMKKDGFGKTVKESERVVDQVDLFKIHHFDNKARSTSLKMLEFNMRSENIEDLPYPPGNVLTDEEKDVLIEYNKHDVLQTLKFYKYSLEAICFRESLTEKYGFDCTNYNDTKIGKEYFIHQLEKLMPGSCYTQTKHGRTINQTKRNEIRVRDIIYPYVKFNLPEFNAILTWFKQQSITETKGVFSDILERDALVVAPYADMKKKQKKLASAPDDKMLSILNKENPSGWCESRALKSGKVSHYWCWNILETLNVKINGFRFDYGVGGIHGSVESTIARSDEDDIIIDADVSSMYPNIAIVNNTYPQHLSKKFCEIYENVYITRKSFVKGTPENAVMKLALNGVYGDSNNKFSPFYDPQYTMTITINGQLSLSMLAEKLIMNISSVRIIQVNTDGVTVKLNRKDVDLYHKLCKEWEKETKLNLEFAEYEMMAIRDVNNYIALYTDGKVKLKGAYEYADFDKLGWHKNHSCMVVAKAAVYELTGKGKAEDFINNHDDVFDFMLRTKVPRSSRLVMVMDDGTEIPQQNICRYFPSFEGGNLIKIMPPLEKGGEDRRMGIDVGWKVMTCNDIKKFDWKLLNRNYFIEEARKLIDPLKEGEKNVSI